MQLISDHTHIRTGKVSPEVRDLVVTTHAAWQAAIDTCRPGAHYRDIGGVIEDIVRAKGWVFSIDSYLSTLMFIYTYVYCIVMN